MTPCWVGSKLKRYVENLNRQHFTGHYFEISAPGRSVNSYLIMVGLANIHLSFDRQLLYSDLDSFETWYGTKRSRDRSA